MNEVNKYGNLALEKDVTNSLKVIKVEEVDMHRGKDFMLK